MLYVGTLVNGSLVPVMTELESIVNSVVSVVTAVTSDVTIYSSIKSVGIRDGP